MFESPFSTDFSFVALSSEDDQGYELSPREAALISDNAAAKRRAEFYLGRAAAHHALRGLGFNPPPPVLKGGGREPIWPENVIGSITHSSGWAIAVVTWRGAHISIGIDLQSMDHERRADLERYVCTPAERAWLGQLPPAERQQSLIAVFSAKESVYKAYYPLHREYLRFHDVELTWAPERDRFVGRFVSATGSTVESSFSVGVQEKRSFVFTFLTLP